MTWLLHNYFLPIISPPINNPEVSLRPLTPYLIEYKNAMKIMIRDVSLASQQKHKVIALIRDIERWIAESKVAANVAEESWTQFQSDPKDIWAMEKFCDQLSEKGRLVPLSKKLVYLFIFDPLHLFCCPGSDNLPPALWFPTKFLYPYGVHFCCIYKHFIQISLLYSADSLFLYSPDPNQLINQTNPLTMPT